MWRWLVIIARDRPELWPTWTCLCRGGVKIDVLVDRRQSPVGNGWRNGPDRRLRPGVGGELEERGFLVIPRPDLVSASREGGSTGRPSPDAAPESRGGL
jgi:hypothetical protein